MSSIISVNAKEISCYFLCQFETFICHIFFICTECTRETSRIIYFRRNYNTYKEHGNLVQLLIAYSLWFELRIFKERIFSLINLKLLLYGFLLFRRVERDVISAMKRVTLFCDQVCLFLSTKSLLVLVISPISFKSFAA